LSEKVRKLSELYAHSQLREKKLQCFFYLMQSKGYPVQQTYQNEVAGISTRRFANVGDINMDTIEQFYGGESTLGGGGGGPEQPSFHSEESYDLLVVGPAPVMRRPSCVPPLDLDGLPQYESSSDEEDNNASDDQQVQQQNLKKPYDYDQTFKYITDYYENLNKFAPVPSQPGFQSVQQSHHHLAPPHMSNSNSHGSSNHNGNNYQHSKLPSAYGSQHHLYLGSSDKENNVTYN
jgi:hypothetical protein